MKILITGATGFIGKVVSRLLGKEHLIFSIVRHSELNDSEINLDLTDENLVDKVLSLHLIPNCDAVIHLASVTASPQKLQDLSVLFDNTVMSKSVALIAKNINAKKVVHISSMAVYPYSDGVFSEESNIRPSQNNDCIYGLSKFNAEVVLDYFLRKANIIITHLRLAIVYGENMPDIRVIPVMEKELVEQNTITVYGNGERYINQIEVNKAALLVKKFVEGDYPGIYNIGDELLTVEELAEKINTAGKGKIIKVPEGNKAKFILDLSKMRSV